MYNSEVKPLYIAFLNSINLSGYKIGLAYELYDQPKISLKNSTLKNCLFGATNIVKNNDKDKWVYSGYGVVFDRGDWWSLSNGSVRNVNNFWC